MPQPRPRVAKKGGVFYDKKTRVTKKTIQDVFRSSANVGRGAVVFPKGVSLKMTVTFFFPRPKYYFGKAARKEPKYIMQQYLGDGILSVTRTDIDNLAKMILDAGNNITMEPYRAYVADRLAPALQRRTRDAALTLDRAGRGLRPDLLRTRLDRQAERLGSVLARLSDRATRQQAERTARLAALDRLRETLGHLDG